MGSIRVIRLKRRLFLFYSSGYPGFFFFFFSPFACQQYKCTQDLLTSLDCEHNYTVWYIANSFLFSYFAGALGDDMARHWYAASPLVKGNF